MLNNTNCQRNGNQNHTQDFPGRAVVKNPPANAGDMGLSPASGKIPHAAEQLSLSATTTEPAVRAHEPQLLSSCATTTEARVPRARARQQEKPPQ